VTDDDDDDIRDPSALCFRDKAGWISAFSAFSLSLSLSLSLCLFLSFSLAHSPLSHLPEREDEDASRTIHRNVGPLRVGADCGSRERAHGSSLDFIPVRQQRSDRRSGAASLAHSTNDEIDEITGAEGKEQRGIPCGSRRLRHRS